MSDNYKFVSDSFENEISELVLPSMFPALNTHHKQILLKYIVRLINIIAVLFQFHKNGKNGYEYEYEYQLKQNNYQDIKWLITHLLPFINEKSDMSKITSFNDIYLKKKINVDINTNEPKYVYSNLQYNRFDRTVDKFAERPFNEADINDNFCILIETLKTMSHKMHVNWVDILPYTLKTYESTDLFTHTHDKIKTRSFVDWDPIECSKFEVDDYVISAELVGKIKGLQIEDMYNVISNDLYQSIKNIKWLIYDIYVTPHLYPMVFVLRKFFDLRSCLSQIAWEDFKGKADFESMWSIFLSTVESGDNMSIGTFVLGNKSLVKLFSGFILSFDKGASNNLKSKALENGYIETPKTNEYLKKIGKLIANENDDSDEDDEEEHTLSFETLLPTLKSLKIRHVYDFITESLQKFKNTWYGTKLLTDDKKDVKSTYGYVSIKNNTNSGIDLNVGYTPLTYKNVYNFSKSFVHIVSKNGKPFKYPDGWETIKGHKLVELLKDTEFIPLPTNWRSLDADQKIEIAKRLNNGHRIPMEWFNIARNIKYSIIDARHTTKDINLINNEIHKLMLEKLANIVFETLIIKGVLTQFVPNKDKTNRNHIARDDVYKLQSDIFSESETNDYWTSAYHYLTNIPYCKMERFYDESIRGESFSYFSYAKTKGNDWYLIYAYNWIAQIGFCHHFLNNRVQFITGATGVGKSTEIPKLFLYFSKAIGYIQAPKIICTEPRIEPTRSNASRIATCLGLPIFVPIDEKGTKGQTKNYYIQTKYDGSDAHSQNVSHAMLQFMTDGVLILGVNDPLMKVSNIDTITKKAKYNDINMYDIIMIDESHEHTINMDLLLTMLRHATTYNNSIKLVILSATMDDDESKYRRYFRNINDNRKYPLNTWIRDNKLDRINVDRRYHISPPETGTQYKVTEHYCPESTEKELVNKILTESDYGDILVFEPSSKKIIALVEELNKIMPNHVIALPYFSKMDDKQNEWKKKVISKIHEKLKTIKMDRRVIFSDQSVTELVMTTGNNVYTRAVIVATNIAEASITFPSVKFVIDTGTQIIMKYDYRKRSVIQETINISESSRLQRKGRVGRKSSGTVYYLYKKGFLESNTLEYEISRENLTLNLFGRLRQNITESIIIDQKHDPNNPSVKIKQQDLKEYFDNFGLAKTIKKQYFIGNIYYDYFGNNNMYDYNNYESLPAFYESGLDMCTLTDNRGKFYLIHPNELELQRNIAGQITGKSETKNSTNSATYTKDGTYSGYILSKKIRSFWQMMLDYLYITFNDKKTDIVKSTLGTEIVKFSESLKLDDSYHGLVRMIIFGMGFGCAEEILRLAAFYISSSFNTLTITNPTINSANKKLIYKSGVFDEETESGAILEILNKLHTVLHKYHITNNITNDENMYANTLSGNISGVNFTHAETVMLLGPAYLHTLELKNKISSQKVSRIVTELEKILINNQIYKLRENINDFIAWCNVNNLNGPTLVNYIKEYLKLKSMVSRNMTPELTALINSISGSFERTAIMMERNVKSIDLALLFGFPFNICKKIDKSNYYLSLYNPNLDNIYLISSSSRYKYKPISLIKIQNFQKYIMFLTLSTNVETDENNLACIHKVDAKLFSILSHIYSNMGFKKITKNIKIMNEIDNVIKSKLQTQNMDLSYAITGYTASLKEIEKDLSDYNDLKTIKFIKEFDTSLDTLLC